MRTPASRARSAAAQAQRHAANPQPLPPPPDFTAALCVRPSADPDLWASSQPRDQRLASAICRRCPVITDCLAYALALPAAHDHGTWAATTQAQRAALRAASVA